MQGPRFLPFCDLALFEILTVFSSPLANREKEGIISGRYGSYPFHLLSFHLNSVLSTPTPTHLITTEAGLHSPTVAGPEERTQTWVSLISLWDLPEANMIHDHGVHSLCILSPQTCKLICFCLFEDHLLC